MRHNKFAIFISDHICLSLIKDRIVIIIYRCKLDRTTAKFYIICIITIPHNRKFLIGTTRPHQAFELSAIKPAFRFNIIPVMQNNTISIAIDTFCRFAKINFAATVILVFYINRNVWPCITSLFSKAIL